MNRLYLRTSSALLALSLAGQLSLPLMAAPEIRPAPASFTQAAETYADVEISAENFPDAAFRSWLLNPKNLNGAGADGTFTSAEISNIRTINVSDLGIETLQGIELFPALESLACKNNRLKTLDVSSNRALRHLSCSFNQISSLDVSNLTQLISLDCDSNHMTSLNLENCSALEVLYCRNNDLSAIDFSTNTRLKFIHILDNRLTKVDLSMLKDLEFVHLNDNLLTDIDLSSNTNLSSISSGFIASNNSLNTLTLPNKEGLLIDPEVYAEQNPKTGYERVEWYADEDYTIPVTEPVPARSQKLHAKWLANDYTIHFAPGGGSGSMAPQAAVWDTPLNLSPNTLHRAGYTFAGWENTYGDSQVYSDGSEVLNLGGKYQGDRVTLYALWEPIQYTINFDATEGEGSMDTLSCTYDENVSLTPSSLAAPEGKVFAGWALSEDGTVRFRDSASVRNLAREDGTSVTLYAVWKEPLSNQYLNQLDEQFALYSSDQYTEQDWTALTGIYSKACTDISSADEETIADIYEQAISQMAAVPTLSQHVEQVVPLWESKHSSAVSAVSGKTVDESSASGIYEQTQLALQGINAEFIKDNTALDSPADQELVAGLASAQVEDTLALLPELASAASWAMQLNGISLLPDNQVSSDRYTAYQAACAQAGTYSAYLSEQLFSSLESKKALAFAKQQSLSELHLEYQSFDFSLYSENGLGKLEDAAAAGRLAIESAGSPSEASSALAKALSALHAVPTQEEENNSGGSGGGNIGGGTGGGNIGDGSDQQPEEPEQPGQTTVTDEVSGASAVVSVSAEGAVRAEITVPSSGTPAVLTIPCDVSPSTVAVLQAADGSRSVLPWTVPVQDGLMVRVDQSCTIELESRTADYSDVASQSW